MGKIIGLTPLYDNDLDSLWMLKNYGELLEDLGINHVILPFLTREEDIEDIADRLDGFIFSGGQDVDPSIYKEENRRCKEAAPQRDFMEKILMKALSERDKPVLGICRGFQLMNAVLGGSLYQDLKEEFAGLNDDHEMEKPYTDFAHFVNVTDDGFLAITKEDRFETNSLHHQGIKKLAPELVEICRSDDGLIEGAYHPKKRFFYGIQWHPEYAYKKSPANVNIMKAFRDAL